MFDLPNLVTISAAADGKTVTATVIALTRGLAQDKIDGRWWVLPDVSKRQREVEHDYHWRWGKRLGELKNDKWHEAAGLQTDDGYVQGAILYWLNTVSFMDPTLGSVYVEALATAPHSRPWLVKSPVYRGAGDALLLRAVMHSYLLGLGGRVHLEAFDDPRVLDFYQKRGFAVVGHDAELPRLELNPLRAELWLKDEGFDL